MPTIPSAIHGASAPAVRSGLNASEDPTPPNPPEITAIASITTATSMMRVARSIGVLLSPRSVRYQWPSSSPPSTEPRNAAPASSSNSASA